MNGDSRTKETRSKRSDKPINSDPMTMKAPRIAIILLASLLPVLSPPDSRAAMSGGYMYVGVWPNKILVIDEASYKVVGEIALQSGVPEYIIPSHDGSRLIAITGQAMVEVIDLSARKVAGRIPLCDASQRPLVINVAMGASGRYLYLTLKTATKEVDRFTVEKAKFHIVDLDLRKIVKTFDFPKDYDRGFGFEDAAYKASADGKFLYVFKDDVLIFDLNTFQQVDKIELSKPAYPGLFSISLAGETDPNENPDVVTSLFNATDPHARRSVAGVAKVNLASRQVELIPLGPSLNTRGRLYLGPGGKKAFVVVVSDGMDPNRRTEFWVFDLQARKLVKRAEFENRARFTFAVSAGAKKLYIYGPGTVIDIYDADSLTFEKTITVDGDITEIAIVPSAQ